MAPRFAEGAAGCNLCHGMLRVLLVTEEVMAGHCAGNCQRSFDSICFCFPINGFWWCVFFPSILCSSNL